MTRTNLSNASGTQRSEVARDISYCHSARGRTGRVFIRLAENATGRLRMIKRAKGYEHEVANGRDFWEVMVDRFGLSLDVIGGALENIPRTGPLILIANHPYGILDGLMMGHILQQTRGDFRILANSVFRKARDLDEVVLPISFDETKEAVKQNVETRKEALRYLGAGGAIGIFPGGTVSTSSRPFGRPMDPGWRSFAAKMVARSDATVVPIFFDGHNSRLFQLASHLHANLRMALLIKEFKSRVDEPVRVVIGSPLPSEQLAAFAKNPGEMMEYMRAQTYQLSPTPLPSLAHGYEFEEKRRVRSGRG